MLLVTISYNSHAWTKHYPQYMHTKTSSIGEKRQEALRKVEETEGDDDLRRYANPTKSLKSMKIFKTLGLGC